MDSKKFFTATIAGAVTMFVLGFLIYGILLDSFMRANVASAAVMKTQLDFGPLIVAQLGWGAFLALVIGQWGGVSTFAGGARAGAMLGALLGIAFDLEMFAAMNFMNLQATLADVIVQVVRFGIAGGVVGQALGMGGRR